MFVSENIGIFFFHAEVPAGNDFFGQAKSFFPVGRSAAHHQIVCFKCFGRCFTNAVARLVVRGIVNRKFQIIENSLVTITYR